MDEDHPHDEDSREPGSVNAGEGLPDESSDLRQPPPSATTDEYERRRGDPTQYNAHQNQFRCLHVHEDKQCPRFEKFLGSRFCDWHDQLNGTPLQLARTLKVVPDSEGPEPNVREWKVQCTKLKDDDTRCNNWSVKGLNICAKHGGNQPAIRELGQRVMRDKEERYKLAQLATKYGVNGAIENPLLALQVIAAEALAFKDFARDQVEKLEAEEWTYTDRQMIEQVRAMIQLYERAMDRAGKLLADMARINIDERLAQVTERQADITAIVLETVLRRLDLGDRVVEARNLIGHEFKALAAG